MFRYHLLGGDTSAPGGLYARLCHAFISSLVICCGVERCRTELRLCSRWSDHQRVTSSLDGLHQQLGCLLRDFDKLLRNNLVSSRTYHSQRRYKQCDSYRRNQCAQPSLIQFNSIANLYSAVRAVIFLSFVFCVLDLCFFSFIVCSFVLNCLYS